MSNARSEGTVAQIKEAMIEKHIPMVIEAGEKGVQILCLQEIFYGPYFCCEQDIKWYESAESVPGPTTDRFSEYAKKYKMVIILPVYEVAIDGVYYNTGRCFCTYIRESRITIVFIHPIGGVFVVNDINILKTIIIEVVYLKSVD